MPQEQSYKTFRVNINTVTLLDDFTASFISDISNKFQPVFQLQQDYCAQLEQDFIKLQTFPEFSGLIANLSEIVQKLKDDFSDCEENVKYFTLVFMGAVSAGKTSMICDLLNVNPDQLNQALRVSRNFQQGRDEVVISHKVATSNIYEFLIDSSCIRLVDVPGIGGPVHGNITIAPFINKADCVIFLSNGQSDLTRDDYDFVLHHIVGLQNSDQLTPKTASNKKALIVINKWNTVAQDLPLKTQEQQWLDKSNWILWGDSKKGKGGTFKGLSELFKRPLTIVRATTSKRILDKDSGRYERYGDIQLDDVVDALKNILIEEGTQIKLERPKIILKHSLSNAQEVLENERIKQSLDELVAKLKQMGAQISLDSKQIMFDLSSRLDSLQNRLKNDLFYRIKHSFDKWKPTVSVKERIMGAWPKEWWGSDKFGAEAVQDELTYRWKTEIEYLVKESIKLDDIKRIISDEADLISKTVETTFKLQLATLENQVLKHKLSQGVSVQSFDSSSFSSTGSSQALKDAVNKASSKIRYSILDDIIGILTIDAIATALIGALLTPVGSVIFLAIRRWMKGVAEEEKAKREIEEAIWRIADEVSSILKEQVANKLRTSVQIHVDSITQIIEGERYSLSNLLQTLDKEIATVKSFCERLDALSKS